MTNLDQFESVFKSADKAVYTYDRPTFDRVLLVTDLNEADAAGIANRVRSFLTAIDEANTLAELEPMPGWRLHALHGDRLGTWSISLSGNWRITFQIVDDAVHDLNLEDYH